MTKNIIKNIISTPHVVRINKDRKLILTLDTIKFLREVIKTGRNNVYKYLEEHKNDKNRNTPILLPPISTSFVSSTKNAPHVDYCMWTNCEAGPSIIDDSVIYYRMSYYEAIQVNCSEVWLNKGLKQINIKQPSMLTGNIFFKNVLRTFFEDNPDGNLTNICNKIKEEHTSVGLDNLFFVGPNVVACDNYKYHCYYTEMSDQNQPFMFNAIGLLRDYNDYDYDDDFSLLYSKSCIGFNANSTTASFEGERHIRTLMGELKSKRTDTSKRYNGIVKHYARTLSPKPTEEETNNPKAFEEEESMEENKVMTVSTSPLENKEPHDPIDSSDIISVLDHLIVFGKNNGFDETVLESITKIKEQPDLITFCIKLYEFVKKENMKVESNNKITKEE